MIAGFWGEARESSGGEEDNGQEITIKILELSTATHLVGLGSGALLQVFVCQGPAQFALGLSTHFGRSLEYNACSLLHRKM